jgi:diguanylate cyclase (GGDEF)-like protein
MNFLASKRLTGMVSVALAIIAVCIGGYFVGYSAITNMQRTHVQYIAANFAKDLAVAVPQLKKIALGEVNELMANAILTRMRATGTVFKFEIYDQSGNLRGQSSFLSKRYVIPSDEAALRQRAREVFSDGHIHFTLEEGTGERMPKFYSRIMVPLSVGNSVVGVLAVLSDETGTWPQMLSQFKTVIAQVLMLISFAFTIPAVIAVRKTGQLKAASRRLRQSSQYDALTGALNRAEFARVTQGDIEDAGNDGPSVAVHFIDLDRFKDINDTRGHAVGDELLKMVTLRLGQLLGTSERLARLGGNEFAICQPYPADTPGVVADLADKVVEAIAQPFVIDKLDVQIAASAGYAFYPADGQSVAELLRAADIALYKAKQSRRGKALAFNSSMEAERQFRQNIEIRLRHALANGEFEINFQPLYESSSVKLCGFEALLRLKDRNGVPIPPSDFIPVAEEVGLIGEIGQWVLRQSCRIAKQWPDDLVVSVNLSPAQFAGGSMAQMIKEALDWSGLRPQRLEVEVTESLLITDTDKILAELMAIKQLGVSIALDDFGTGYSSLSYLWRFPFDKLKVDKSFMSDLTTKGSKSREILATIIALGRVLGIKVTAEGVETEQQAEVLRELNCDLVQGYFFGRPMDATGVASTIGNSADFALAQKKLRTNRT